MIASLPARVAVWLQEKGAGRRSGTGSGGKALKGQSLYTFVLPEGFQP